MYMYQSQRFVQLGVYALPRFRRCGYILSGRITSYRSYSQKYWSSEEVDDFFPSAAALELCGATLNVTIFPQMSDLRGIDVACLEKLERLDKYPSNIDADSVAVHPNNVLAFHGGRIALRRALRMESPGRIVPGICRLPSGAPSLPPQVSGSISHKDGLAVAGARLRPDYDLGVPISNSGHIGVDIEYESLKKSTTYLEKFARRVLTDNEVNSLGNIAEMSINEEIMLRFSLKESVYKSIEPELKRYVSYKEVEVQPQFDGTASVTYLLVEPKKKFSSIAQWIRFSPPAIIGDLYKAVRPTFWITCAYSFEFTET